MSNSHGPGGDSLSNLSPARGVRVAWRARQRQCELTLGTLRPSAIIARCTGDKDCCGPGLLQCLRCGGGPSLGPDSHCKTPSRSQAPRTAQAPRQLTRTPSHWPIRPKSSAAAGEQRSAAAAAAVGRLGLRNESSTAAAGASARRKPQQCRSTAAAGASARRKSLLPCAGGGGGGEGGP